MTRLLPLFLLLLQSAFLGAADNALLTRVGIMPMKNSGGDARYDAVCHTVTDTVTLTLELLGSYAVVEITDQGTADSPESLAGVARTEKLDNLIYGHALLDKDGGLVLEASVYDRQKEAVTITSRSTAAGILDVFDAADKLVVSLLESLSGMHIGFGAVKLEAVGEKGSYSVFIDGNPAGQNPVSISRVLNGRHTVRVAQNRMLGNRTIGESIIEVAEDEQVTVGFRIPLLLDEEKAELGRLEQAIGAGWEDRGELSRVEQAVAKLQALVADTPYAPGLSAMRLEYRQKAVEWEVQKSLFSIEEGAKSPSLEPLISIAGLTQDPGDIPRPEVVRALVERNVSMQATLLELSAGTSLAAGRFDEAATVYSRIAQIAVLFGTGSTQRPAEDAGSLSLAIRQYEERKKERNLVLPLLALAGGLGMGAGSAYLFAGNIEAQFVAEGSRLYAQYQAATDSATANSLHQQVQTQYNLANAATIGKWAGAAGGAVLSGLGAWGVLGSDPEAWLRERINARFKGLLGAAQRFQVGIGRKGRLLILADPLGAEVSVDGRSFGPAPVVVDPGTKTEVEVAVSAGGQTARTKVRVDRGICFLAVGSVPQAPRELTATANTDGSVLLKWGAVAGAAAYIVQVAAGTGGDFGSLIAEIVDMAATQTSFTPPAKATGSLIYRVATVAAGGMRGEWSEPAATQTASQASGIPVAQPGEPDAPVENRWVFQVAAGAAMNYRLTSIYPIIEMGFAYRFWDSIALGVDVVASIMLTSVYIGPITIPFIPIPIPFPFLVLGDEKSFVHQQVRLLVFPNPFNWPNLWIFGGYGITFGKIVVNAFLSGTVASTFPNGGQDVFIMTAGWMF